MFVVFNTIQHEHYNWREEEALRNKPMIDGVEDVQGDPIAEWERDEMLERWMPTGSETRSILRARWMRTN
jgi:hypothetical protein